MNLDLLVLDWDGVISASRDPFRDGINAALMRRGLPPVTADDISRNYRADQRQFYVERGVKDVDAMRTEANERYRAIQHTVPAIPGAIEAVQELASHVPIAIFSSAPEQTIVRDIQRFRLGNAITYVRGGVTKGSAAGFLRLLDRAGATPGQTLYGGDTVVDIELAHLANALSIAIVDYSGGYGYQSLEIVSAYEPQPTHSIVRHVRELIPLVKNGV